MAHMDFHLRVVANAVKASNSTTGIPNIPGRPQIKGLRHCWQKTWMIMMFLGRICVYLLMTMHMDTNLRDSQCLGWHCFKYTKSELNFCPSASIRFCCSWRRKSDATGDRSLSPGLLELPDVTWTLVEQSHCLSLAMPVTQRQLLDHQSWKDAPPNVLETPSSTILDQYLTMCIM